MAAEQALHFGMGAEALAADVLTQIATRSKPRTGSTQTANSQNGQSAQNTQSAQNPAQVTSPNRGRNRLNPCPSRPRMIPKAEPIGTVQGALEDMQGRFNLNNLAHASSSGRPTEQDPQPLEQFQRLLVSVGLEPKWAGIARDWIDADDQPGSPDGAEDAIYTAQTPPYRTGNWPMTSPSELMNMPGFGADRYRKIAPYVTALPTAIATINICTAPAVVLESLADNLNGEYSGSPEVLIERPQDRLLSRYPDASTTSWARRWRQNSPIGSRTRVRISVSLPASRLALRNSPCTVFCARGNGGKVTPLLRTFGTL